MKPEGSLLHSQVITMEYNCIHTPGEFVDLKKSYTTSD